MIWLGGLLRRRWTGLVGTALSVALAVSFLGALGGFFAASKARMTWDAIAGVPVDWQVLLSRGANPVNAERIISSAPTVRVALLVQYADTPGFKATSGGSVQTTGSGQVLGIPGGYAEMFPGEVRFLVGARSGVLLAQQTAANLHAGVGSVISFARPSLPRVTVRVAGIVDLPQADSMFQAIGAAPAAAPQAPPDNVLLLPSASWHRYFDPAAIVRPDTVRAQFHVGLRHDLPPDPSGAFSVVLASARNLEARLAGAGLVGNNLGAQLDANRADSIYAQLLFLFLGLPAVILAALLAMAVAGSGRERRRKEQALLRVRGAGSRTLFRLAAAEALLVGVLGALLGLAGAAAAGIGLLGSARLGASAGQAAAWAAAAAFVGMTVSVVAVVVPAWRDARSLSVREARASVGQAPRPIWMNMYLDVLLLAAAGLVYWQALKSGYQVVLAPEGVPTISVSYVTFLAPLMLWAGSALLAWRLSSAVLSGGRRMLRRAVRPLAGTLAGVVAASMGRQRRLLSRVLVVMVLTGSFAASTAVFNATYAAQSRVDAELTNGADVTATTAASAGLPPGIVARVEDLPGTSAAESMQHRFAYVGNDLQDLYGIDPATIGRATPMSDAFFAGGHASQVLARLAARPDAVLVSEETVHDFQLQPGDLLRLRLQFADDHAYHVVPFHYIGIVREFPTAPRDSFLVANASYVSRVTGSPAPQTLLVKARGSPPAVAHEVRAVLGQSAGATVQDIVSERKVTLSSLTALDLTGLTRLELTFAFLLAAAASGLVLALGLAERRRTFAIATALGASSRQLGAFVWSEAVYVTIGGLALGAMTGWGLSFVLVKELTGVFDPPPQSLDIPWAYLGLIVVVTLAAIASAAWLTITAARRPTPAILREL